MVKKYNPNDTTLRNTRALWKQLIVMHRRVKRIERHLKLKDTYGYRNRMPFIRG